LSDRARAIHAAPAGLTTARPIFVDDAADWCRIFDDPRRECGRLEGGTNRVKETQACRFTDEEVPRTMSPTIRGTGRFGVQPVVFGFSVGLTVLFVVLTLANLGAADAMFSAVKEGIARRFGWFFILSVQGILLLCIYLAASRFGHIRIGGAGARPEFSSLSGFAMLFAAGMGIGLMFWSVAEPVLHLQDPPGAAAMTPEGAQRALDLTFLHWGLHAWGIYALVGLALAYFTYNCSAIASTDRSVMPSMSWRCWRHCSDSPPRSGWVLRKSMPGSTTRSDFPSRPVHNWVLSP
jgi:hypothetical protein